MSNFNSLLNLASIYPFQSVSFLFALLFFSYLIGKQRTIQGISRFLWGIVVPSGVLFTTYNIFKSPVASTDSKYAISNAVYFGVSPSRPILIALFVTLSGFFLSMTTYFWTIKEFKNISIVQNDNSLAGKENFSKRVIWAKPSLKNIKWEGALLLTIITCLPEINSRLEKIISPFVSTNFDTMNIEAWRYFISIGFEPMVDFWYPYGNFHKTIGSFLGLAFVSILWFYTFNCLILQTETLEKYKNFARLILIAICLFSASDWVASTRYLIPFVTLFMWSKSLYLGKIPRIHGIVLISLFYLDSTLAFFVNLLAIVGLTIFFYVNKAIRSQILTQFALYAGCVLLAYLLIGPQLLNATIKQIINSKDMTQLVYSLDFGVSSQAYFPNFAIIPTAILFLLIQSTLYQIALIPGVSQQSNRFQISGPILILSSYVWYKDLVRGGMGIPLFLYATSTILFYLSVTENKSITTTEFTKMSSHSSIDKSRAMIEKVLQFISLGIMTCIILLSNGLVSSLIENIEKSFRSVLTNTRIIFKNEIDFNITKNTSYYMADADPEIAMLKNSDLKLFGEVQKGNIYVLGNRPNFYMLNTKKPFWTISDWSSIRDQNKTLLQLIVRQPTYVYFDRRQETMNFDRVSPLVRNSVIYSYIVKNYVFEKSLGEGDILKRIHPESGIDWEYWNEVLANEMDFGFILDGGGLSCSGRATSEDKTTCLTFQLRDDLKVQVYKIDFKCDYGSYGVSIRSSSKKQISLDAKKLWFFSNSCRYKIETR